MTIAFVQSPASPAANTSTTSLNLAFGSNNSAGSVLLACIRVGALGRTITVTDSNNGTWPTQLVTQAQASDGHQGYIIGVSNAVAAANTVTVGISGAAASIRYNLLEYSGATLTLDGTAVSAQGTSVSPASGTSATTNANSLLLSFITQNGAVALTAPAFTNTPGGSTNTRPSLSTFFQIFDNIAPGTTGSYGAQGSQSASDAWAASFIALLPATASTGAPRGMMLGVG